jgi:uncharacterized membrane protein HdeD (DUF308 family)
MANTVRSRRSVLRFSALVLFIGGVTLCTAVVEALNHTLASQVINICIGSVLTLAGCVSLVIAELNKPTKLA